VIVASADIQQATRAMVEEAGARAFIHKPFAIEQVLTTVNAVLQGGRQWS
jgi:DNA-binding response OmpR family regulator